MNYKPIAIALAFAMLICTVPIAAADSEAADTSGNTYAVTLVEGAAYSYTPTYSLTGVTTTLSGTAASWLSVSGNTVSGTAPSVASSGTYSEYALTIKATTTNPTQTAYQYIQFKVYDTLTVSGTSSDVTYIGDTISMTSASNYASGVTYSMAGAPNGLSIDPSTGAITGTVSGTTGTKNATVTAAHAASAQTKTYSVAFDVTAVLNITSGANMYAVNGQILPAPGAADHYEMAANLTGVTYTVTSGSLPSGISMSSDGKFSGTPTSTGSSTVTITATHASSGQTDTHQLTVAVSSPLGFTSTPTGGIIVTPV